MTSKGPNRLRTAQSTCHERRPHKTKTRTRRIKGRAAGEQSIDRTPNRWLRELSQFIIESIDGSINRKEQSFNQSMSQSINQSTNQSSNDNSKSPNFRPLFANCSPKGQNMDLIYSFLPSFLHALCPFSSLPPLKPFHFSRSHSYLRIAHPCPNNKTALALSLALLLLLLMSAISPSHPRASSSSLFLSFFISCIRSSLL